ncbi:hypothetical protein [Idiomarina seosinensis]|uniref:MSHA biogenesis protein MshJ n=1 Tax=Idiomarina seosinensis TaxID=281739 RepID=A0A432ZDH7_9GAMM|nr:hypothetical protein [Idiomarina seosinensis]RUO75949.1 hypothetical protein CWI81_07435 [Idiomarina seosinensis]
MRQWHDLWQQYCEKFSELPKERRALIAVAAWVLVTLPLISYGVLPQQEQLRRDEQKIRASEQQIEQLEIASAQLQQQLAVNVDKPLLEEIKRKQARLASLKEKTDSYTLLDQSARRKFIENALDYPDGIALVSLESSSPEAITTEQTVNLYRHRVNASYQGNFTELQEFFRELRKRNPEVQWYKFRYKVTDYPQARVDLAWQLLSVDKEIIGG